MSAKRHISDFKQMTGFHLNLHLNADRANDLF